MLDPYIMFAPYLKLLCVTARRPAGPPAKKLFLTLVTVPGAANVLAPYIMCDPYTEHMCVTGRRPGGEQIVSHISN